MLTRKGMYKNVADWWVQFAKPVLADFFHGFHGKEIYQAFAMRDGDWKTVTVIRGKLNKFLQEDCMGFIVRSNTNRWWRRKGGVCNWGALKKKIFKS